MNDEQIRALLGLPKTLSTAFGPPLIDEAGTTSIDVAFPIQGMKAHPSRFRKDKLADDLPYAITLDPSMPTDEIHFVSGGTRFVVKIKD